MDEVYEPAPTPAVRLIFEYEGDVVRLVAQQPVDVAVTGFDLAALPHPGEYAETRTVDNQPLSRVPLREAFANSAEVFPENPSESITRVDIPKPKGAFTVIVPADANASHVALLRVQTAREIEAPRPGTRATTPTPGKPEVVEMATFPLAGAALRVDHPSSGERGEPHEYS